MNEDSMPSKRMVLEQDATPLQERIRAIIMRYFGLPDAGDYPGATWQQLDSKYQRLADELIAATQEPTEAEIAAVVKAMDDEPRVFCRRNKTLDGPQFEVVFEPDSNAPISEDNQIVVAVYATLPEAAQAAENKDQIERARHYLIAASRARST